MHGPASLPLQGSHQLWCKEQSVRRPGSRASAATVLKGSDLGQFPSILRTLLAHLYCSRLVVKGLCSHGSWESSIALSMSSPQNFPKGNLPLLKASVGAISQSPPPQRPREWATPPALCPLPLSGPRTCTSNSPHLSFSALSQVSTRTRPCAYLSYLPHSCLELFPRSRSCPPRRFQARVSAYPSGPDPVPLPCTPRAARPNLARFSPPDSRSRNIPGPELGAPQQPPRRCRDAAQSCSHIGAETVGGRPPP